MDGKTARHESILEVRDVSCGYGDIRILQHVSFSVRRGESFYIIGRSGCGKSTLLRNIIGLEFPLAGDVLFDGRSIPGVSQRERLSLLRRMGVLYQGNALWSTMTVGENVALPLEEYTGLARGEIRELVALKLGMVGLEGVEPLYPSELSGGMRKRAALARALILDPEILFFDEPSAGLDPVGARSLDKLIRDMKENLNTTIVVVSHDVESILTVADRVVMLGREEQTVVAMGSPDALLREREDPRIAEFFQGAALTYGKGGSVVSREPESAGGEPGKEIER